jgi:hypothetical protein
MKTFNSPLIPACLAVGILLVGSSISNAQSGDGIQDTLAAQIRTQGFACDKALSAIRETIETRSRGVGADMQQRDLPGEPCARHGCKGGAAAMMTLLVASARGIGFAKHDHDPRV